MADKPQSPLWDAVKISFAVPFGAVLQLLPEGDDAIWIDGRKTPPHVGASAPADIEAACVWRGERGSLTRAVANNRAFESAYVSGRIAVAGDMSVMARLELGVQK